MADTPRDHADYLVSFADIKQRKIVGNHVTPKTLDRTGRLPPGFLLGPNTRVWWWSAIKRGSILAQPTSDWRLRMPPDNVEAPAEVLQVQGRGRTGRCRSLHQRSARTLSAELRQKCDAKQCLKEADSQIGKIEVTRKFRMIAKGIMF
jgi:hypothetical protein